MDDQRNHFISKLHALNEGFAAFVEGQLKNQKSELWLEGVKEYIKYGEALLEEFKHVKADTPGSKSLTFGANAFGTKSLQTGAQAFGAPKEKSLANGVGSSGEQKAETSFNMLPQPSTSGAEQGNDQPAPGFFNFGSKPGGEKAAPPLAGGFNFGATTSGGEAPGFNFGAKEPAKGAAGGGGGLFSFGAAPHGGSPFSAIPKPGEGGAPLAGQPLFGGLPKPAVTSSWHPIIGFEFTKYSIHAFQRSASVSNSTLR